MHSFTVIAIHTDGRQLTGTGFENLEACQRHIADRVRWTDPSLWAQFLLVMSDEQATVTRVYNREGVWTGVSWELRYL
jgi:hypothetical protein